MRKYYKSIFFALFVLLAYPEISGAASSVKPLEVGVVPYLSARVLVSSYEPMRLYLEKTLNIPVKIYTAPGFKQFQLNCIKGDYDFIITAAHLARMLQIENGFTPMARYEKGGHGLMMTALKSNIHTPQDLVGKTIAMPDKLSLSSIVSLTYLRKAGLNAGTDYQLLEVPSFTSAIWSVQNGDAVAAVSASGAIAQMPDEMRNSVSQLFDTGKFISLIFLAHPRVDKQLSRRINATLFKFTNKTIEGKTFFSNNGFGSIVPATENDMRTLDIYAPETKRLLEKTL